MTVGELESLSAAVGYRPGAQSRDLIERALRKVSDALGVPSEQALRNVLSRDPPAWRAFCESVPVHETWFFRHPEHFDLIERQAREAASAGRPLHAAWSVGCSTGEELWSLLLKLLPWAPEVRVCGSDLSAEALEVARGGCYPARSVRGPEAACIAPWLRSAEGGVTIPERLRERAAFCHLNLAKDPIRPPPGFPAQLDVIFCRNVLLYLRPEVCASVLEALAAQLVPGGLLVVGAMDVDALPAGLEGVNPAFPGVLRRRVPGQPPASPGLRRPGTRSASSPALPQVLPLAQARTLADAGRLTEALAVAEGQGSDLEACYLAGCIQLELGAEERAVELFRRILAARPDAAPAHLQLALIALRAGDHRGLNRHRRGLEQLLVGRSDDEVLAPGALRTGWARQVLGTLGGAHG
jgi:chemotaxis protein methyltransferase CheR